jgi:hypothetical protein
MGNGQPVCARFTLRYAAMLGRAAIADQKAEAKFIPLFNKCSTRFTARSTPEALNQYQQAAEAADKLSTLANNKNKVAA